MTRTATATTTTNTKRRNRRRRQPTGQKKWEKMKFIKSKPNNASRLSVCVCVYIVGEEIVFAFHAQKERLINR